MTPRQHINKIAEEWADRGYHPIAQSISIDLALAAAERFAYRQSIEFTNWCNRNYLPCFRGTQFEGEWVKYGDRTNTRRETAELYAIFEKENQRGERE